MEGIFDTKLAWLLAEGSRGDKPCLYRGREIPTEFVGTAALPILFVVSCSFEVTDSTGLPAPQQYEDVGKFERDFIETIESRRLGVLAFVQTCDGVVKYFMYVSDVELVSTQLTEVANFSLKCAITDDPDWAEYRAFTAGMKHG